MSPPNTEFFRKAKQWMIYGDEDLRLARHALTLLSGCPYRLIAYHAQQCAEKYLKAYLVYHRIDFPYTHNISRLLELCEENSSWPSKIREAEELTPFAITARYRGEDEKVTKKEALRAVGIAAKIRQTVRKTLKKEGSLF
ncbi:MAG TPA: HEPN domain-containing protein [Thermodesulfobacteriota bacterium]|nr:HEPN domain-containing protein [Thermodesulfobacteriota bacterium]